MLEAHLSVETLRRCRLLRTHKSFLPTPNTLPPSLYILRGLLECEEAAKYEQRACINDCVRFAMLPRSEWAAHRDDACPQCNQKRFECRRGAGNRLIISARKVRSLLCCLLLQAMVRRPSEAPAPHGCMCLCSAGVFLLPPGRDHPGQVLQ